MTSKQKTLVITVATFNQFGGIGTFVTNLSQRLKDLGWRVDLIVTNGGLAASQYREDFTTIHDIADLPLSLDKCKRASDLINSIRPLALITNDSPLIHYALPLIDPRVRPIAIVHNDLSAFYNRACIGKRRIFRWVSPTPKLSLELRKRLPKALHENTVVISHGVSDVVFSPLEKGPRPPRGGIVFAGSLLPHKGVDLLADIMNMVVKKVPSAHLYIAGGGEGKAAAERSFRQMGIADCVSWLGRKQPMEMREVYELADILLLPTRVEGFGLVIAEAMMSGIVPVVTRLSGITDAIVKHGVNGFLVDKDKVHDFAAVIVDLLTDPQKMVGAGVAARRHAQDHLSLDSMVAAYENLIIASDNRKIKARIPDASWRVEFAQEYMLHRWARVRDRLKLRWG